MSLSQWALHSGQSHSRIDSGILSWINPQLGQRFELGKYRSICTTCLPAQSALYCNCRTNSPQFASAICFASLGFLIIFFTARFSTQTSTDKNIVITHHAPSIRSIPEVFLNELESAGYASELEAFIHQHKPNMWLHGCIHKCLDYMIGSC